MELDTTQPVDGIVRISRATDARDVAHATYDRLLDLLERLDPDDWRAPTECAGWDVAAMVGHLIGAAKAGASIRESLRQQRWGKRNASAFGGNALDACNELQVRDHAALTPEERIVALRRLVPAAVAGRMRVPAPMRALRVPLDDGGSTSPGMPTQLVLGHLMDVIYTRDVWLHTVDIARATSRPFEIDPAVDARVVADVVAEWAGRHHEPFVLRLTGPAGGTFRQGREGPALQLDAVEFCRVLSGRDAVRPGDRDASAVPPGAAPLLETMVLF
jgi:uncharacterized protein (TIGR03083 family)